MQEESTAGLILEIMRTSALAVLIPGVGKLTYCRFKDQKNKTSTKQGLVFYLKLQDPETRSLCIVPFRLYILWYDLATNPSNPRRF